VGTASNRKEVFYAPVVSGVRLKTLNTHVRKRDACLTWRTLQLSERYRASNAARLYRAPLIRSTYLRSRSTGTPNQVMQDEKCV